MEQTEKDNIEISLREKLLSEFRTGYQWAAEREWVDEGAKEKFCQYAEAQIERLHTLNRYAVEDSLRCIRIAGNLLAISEATDYANGILAARFEKAAILLRSQSDHPMEARLELAHELEKLGQDWAKIGKFQTAGVAYEDAAISILESREVSDSSLNFAFKLLERSKKAKRTSSDKIGHAFNEMNRSIYWRKLYILSGDESSLNSALLCCERSLKICRGLNSAKLLEFESGHLREALTIPSTVLNALYEIVDLWHSHFERKIASQSVSLEVRDDLNVYWANISDLKLYRSMLANPAAFGKTEEWKKNKTIEYRDLISRNVPSFQRVCAMRTDAIKLSKISAFNNSEAIESTSLDWIRVRALYELPDQREEILQEFLRDMYRRLSEGRLDLAEVAWGRAYSSQIWRKAEGYSEFLGFFPKLPRSHGLGRLVSGRQNSLGPVDAVQPLEDLVVELVQHGVVQDGLNLLREKYNTWFESERKQKEVNRGSLVLLHGFDSSLGVFQVGEQVSVKIFPSLGGSYLASFIYSWHWNEGEGLITEQFKSSKDRRVYLPAAEALIAEMGEIGTWINSVVVRTDVLTIFAGCIGYFRFVPISAIRGKKGNPISDDLNIVLQVQSKIPLADRIRDINTITGTALSAGNAEGWERLETEDECLVISGYMGKQFPIEKSPHREDVETAIRNCDVVHFAGHGTIDSIGSVPSLVAIDGNFKISVPEGKNKCTLLTLSCCSGASVTDPNMMGFQDLASASGVNWLIGAHWPVLESVSRDFFRILYRYISRLSVNDSLEYQKLIEIYSNTVAEVGNMHSNRSGLEKYSFSIYV